MFAGKTALRTTLSATPSGVVARTAHGARAPLSTSRSTFQDNTFKSVFSKMKDQQQEMRSKNQQTVDRSLINQFEGQTTYDPFDFSVAKIRYKKKVMHHNRTEYLKKSSFNAPEINPLDFYCLPQLLSKYLSQSGQILHGSVTGLTGSKQKQLAKAIKRSRAAGLLSSVSQDVTFAPRRGNTL